MDEQDQRNKREMRPRSDQNQAEGKDGDHFVQNGRIHYNHSLYKLVAAALALPLGGAFVGGIVSYRAGLSEVDAVIVKNPAIIELKIDVKNLKENQNKSDDRIKDLEDYARARKK